MTSLMPPPWVFTSTSVFEIRLNSIRKSAALSLSQASGSELPAGAVTIAQSSVELLLNVVPLGNTVDAAPAAPNWNTPTRSLEPLWKPAP